MKFPENPKAVSQQDQHSSHNKQEIPSKQAAINLMRNLGLPQNIFKHEMAVMRKARNLAYNITKIPVNVELVKIGALLHDIGRTQIHSMMHAPVGADILRENGFPEEVARIAERHTMAGLTDKEAQLFELPPRHYIPETIEEKIVCLADKYFMGTTQVTIDQRFQRWMDKYGQTPFLLGQLERAKKMEEEILHLIF
ncbi:MAG: HDIG domain-containing metalloprotein [Promethearchaeota archaeon]